MTDQATMTQYCLEIGIPECCIAGIKAVLDEPKQLHHQNTLDPIHALELQSYVCKQALPEMMLIKHQNSGKIKGHGCADSREQKITVNKADTSSPTVLVESLFLTSLIDPKDGQRVATIDILRF